MDTDVRVLRSLAQTYFDAACGLLEIAAVAS